MNIIKSSPELVSKTRTGNDKFWQAHVVNNDCIESHYDPTFKTRWFTQTSYWQVNKKGVKSIVQFSEPYEATPKNEGKANATTAEEQAYSEFDSMVAHQRDKGYSEEGTVSNVLPLPMLAQKFSERGAKLQWPVFVQPKFNGQRMLYRDGKGWSRGGKDIIPEVIEHLKCDTMGEIIDGELILPGNVLLQETMKATKKYRPDVSPTLLYIVYDMVVTKQSFENRFKFMSDLIKKNGPVNIVLAPTYKAEDIAEVMMYHKQFTSEGYEGTIIRDNSHGYEIGQRSNQLQKLKDFVDGEWKILDVVEGDGRFKGAGIFVCETTEGVQFNCMPEGTMEHRRSVFTDRQKHIGKYLQIRYQELSKDKVPLFPVGVDVRDKGEF